jgi:CheY-like chemotaxis protein
MENDVAHRVLLAEDHRLSRLATQSILEKLGYAVVGVGDGSEAVDAVADGDFDAVVMDCQMPRMDGFQATQEIRRRQRETGQMRIPIIGLSARAMDGDGPAALAKGMDAYLTKPLLVEELRKALEELVVNGAGT